MPFVVAEPCVKCKFTDCVDACPVEGCFKEGENFLVIDPDECIDCGACVPECPVEAIFQEDDVPEEWEKYIEINARLAADWPVIHTKQEPLPDAEKWREVIEKFGQLSENAAS